MQENGDFFAIFSLEDARVASYSLEFRGEDCVLKQKYGISDAYKNN